MRTKADASGVCRAPRTAALGWYSQVIEGASVATRVYVGNLPYSASDEQLREMFQMYGEVSEAAVMRDRSSGLSKGFGFVQMPDAEAARQAILSLNGTMMSGRTVHVNEAEERAPRREFTDRPPRRDFGDRSPRRDFDSRPPRREYEDRGPHRDFGDRPPRRDYDDRGPRREYGDRPPRRDYDDRGPRRDRPDLGKRDYPSRGPRHGERDLDGASERGRRPQREERLRHDFQDAVAFEEESESEE
jgi:RNA recognition motif-containing protein